ncbi:globin CTT-X-like [Chironomus tepperi]|uniref:globin CTT-X-like n=1 Tax=Chironomus tepperi TaxID=113505 RepID=UPI00391F8C19
MKFLILALCIAATTADLHKITLDAHQVHLIQSSWNQVKHNEVDILAAIFRDHPDIQDKFAQFAGKDLETIKDTAIFATHATRSTGFFGAFIALLGSEDNQPAINTFLRALATSHKARGAVTSQFYQFRDSMINYLKSHTSWNDEVSQSWDIVFDMAFAVIFEYL